MTRATFTASTALRVRPPRSATRERALVERPPDDRPGQPPLTRRQAGERVEVVQRARRRPTR